MRILKLSMEGLPNFKNRLDIDFVAQQRVSDEDKAQLLPVFSNVYTNPVLSLIGINASGKTTILKMISFAMNLLKSESINNGAYKGLFDDLDSGQKVIFTAYFYHDGVVYKLKTAIGKTPASIDGKTKLVILDETLWSKQVYKIKTKKGLYDFADAEVEMQRDKGEKFLAEDISIILAFNKQKDTNIYLFDMLNGTNHNLLHVLGRYPKELLTFLDPSIENLTCEVVEKNADIRLKFYGKDEIKLSNPLALNQYLSSGTIKGLSVFMEAVFTFLEGGYLLVDELENHFNREIVLTLVRFFMDKKVNKKGGTLIFSTHYSQLLDEFERNDNIYIIKNKEGIAAEKLSNILKRNDLKKSDIYDSDFLGGTVPIYDSYLALKKAFISLR